ncbi:eCIS core domain-containing protein [Pseudoduganella sp. RAF53_2]|uniref:eCIS core domain-containing protein n=1 Tax=unclassified Pseudoduganella TaxID=2637179 RepID=UPI003F97A047
MSTRRSILIQAHFVHGRGGPTQPVQAHGGQNMSVDAGKLNLSGAVGRPMPDAVRQKMEAFFKADFSGVRIYQGNQAQSIGAHAFTMGTDIYFAPGQYDPHSARGQQLLGHELAHVLQQKQGRVRAPQGAGTVIVNDHALEAEADRMGARAAAFRVPVQAKLATGGMPSAVGKALALQAKQASYRLVIGAYLHQGAAGLPPDLAGHAFVSLQGPAGNRQTWGFSPANYGRYDPQKDIGKLRAGVPGQVHRDDSAFSKPGVKVRSYELNSAQAQAAMAKVNEYRSRHYSFSAQSRQCTTFATDVLRAASVNSGLSGQMRPGDLYRKV